ncbi:TPA: hypothetical protein ACH3X2_002915 [Trebouxia sp. C0005]
MDRAHVSQGPPTPQQADPFASSYFHPSGQSGSGDPFAQSSVGQSSSGQPSFGHHPAPEPYQQQQQQQQQQQFPQQLSQQQQQQPPQQLPQQQYQQQAPPQGPASSHNPFAEGGGFASAQGGFRPASSSVPPHSYSNPPQHLGPRAPYNAAAAPDPFDHLPYPSLGLSRPTKPERAPAPPLASYGKGGPPNSQQLSGQQDQRSMQSVPGSQPPQQAQQQQQQQSQASSFNGNIWAQPDAGNNNPGAASFDFGESAFKPVQTTPPQQSEARPKEAVRPKNLYINSLYNAGEGDGDEQQLPAGFDPSQQVLTRGTGSWGMASPASSPKTGGYMGGSGPPTPEGLQFQHQHSAGSSAATTPAQTAGNSEWDMFFANRVQPNGNGGPGSMSQPLQQQASSQMPDAFDDLLFARAR